MYLSFYNNYISRCFSNKFDSVWALSAIDGIVFLYFILRISILQISPHPNTCHQSCELLFFHSFCPMTFFSLHFFHFTIPNHEPWHQQKGFKLLNLPLKPPICPAHYRFIVISKISCCPPLMFLSTCLLIWPEVQGPLFQSFLQVPSIHMALPPSITDLIRLRASTSSVTHLLHNTQVVSIAIAIQP